jgi:hypothetical protein
MVYCFCKSDRSVDSGKPHVKLISGLDDSLPFPRTDLWDPFASYRWFFDVEIYHNEQEPSLL